MFGQRDDPGLLPLAMADLFARAAAAADGVETLVRASMLELNNEEVRELIALSGGERPRPPPGGLPLKEDKLHGGQYVDGQRGGRHVRGGHRQPARGDRARAAGAAGARASSGEPLARRVPRGGRDARDGGARRGVAEPPTQRRVRRRAPARRPRGLGVRVQGGGRRARAYPRGGAEPAREGARCTEHARAGQVILRLSEGGRGVRAVPRLEAHAAARDEPRRQQPRGGGRDRLARGRARRDARDARVRDARARDREPRCPPQLDRRGGLDARRDPPERAEPRSSSRAPRRRPPRRRPRCPPRRRRRRRRRRLPGPAAPRRIRRAAAGRGRHRRRVRGIEAVPGRREDCDDERAARTRRRRWTRRPPRE